MVHRLKMWSVALLTGLVGLGLFAPVCVGMQADETSVPVVAADVPTVRVDFFFEQGCEDCARVRRDVLPLLEASLGGFYVLHEWDVGQEESYRRLLALLERTATPLRDNATVYAFVDGERALAGVDEIVATLLTAVEERLMQKMSSEESSGDAGEEPAPLAKQDVVRIAKAFTIWGVALAGLVDGINPCAFATLVFLISVLSMSRGAGAGLLAIGTAFCIGSFLAYFLIGLGLLKMLHQLSAFRAAQGVFDVVLIGMLVVLSVYSFIDAVRFNRTHRSADVSIQLPAGIKNRVHRLLRLGLGRRGTVLSAFLIAMAVTALESVCTGQVYVPTLAFIVRSGSAVGRGVGLLVVYNLMFIVPLIIVLVLVHHGLRLPRLMAWSVKEVFVAKLLMGLFFAAMAVLMILL